MCELLWTLRNGTEYLRQIVKGGQIMKVKLVIQTQVASEDGITGYRRSSEIWSGDIDLNLDKGEYLAKLSVIAEGQPQPICDIPFSLGIGYYMWIPPDPSYPAETWDIHQ